MKNNQNNQNLNPTFGKQAAALARQAVEAYVNQQKPSNPQNIHPRLNQPLGAFVTLRKRDKLRGCIGRIQSNQSLWQTLQEMAEAAALEDPRFPPVSPAELNEINIEVSVLTQPVLVNDLEKIEMGKHGVIIKHNGREGVFLPQVAEEQGYDREQFLNSLCSNKLGLPENCWQDPKAQIYVFAAEVYQE